MNGDFTVGRINFAPEPSNFVPEPPSRFFRIFKASPWKKRQALVNNWIVRADRLEKLSESVGGKGEEETAHTLLQMAEAIRMCAEELSEL